MKRVHLILTGLSATIILLSLNRLTTATLGHLQPFEFLRWLDFNAMLPIPLLSVILYYLLKREITTETSPFLKTGLYAFYMVLLITGIYLFGAGSGTHEFANYLHARFCDTQVLNETLCNIVIYNDDSFSHYVYYAGFILMNVALMLIEYSMPRKNPAKRKDLWLIVPNALFIALGIFANLAFEEIGIDLWVFGSVMVLSLILLAKRQWKFGALPVTFYFALSYTVGVVGTLLWKLK